MTPAQSAVRYIAEHQIREGRKPDSVPFSVTEWAQIMSASYIVALGMDQRNEFDGILVRFDDRASMLRESYIWPEV